VGTPNLRPFVDVPIRLQPQEVDSPLAGRVAFVDTDGISGDWAGTCKTLSSLPGVVVPDGPSDLFGRGMQALFRNVLASREAMVTNGIATLVDDATFLRECRALADAVYIAALTRHGATRVVDASATNSAVLEVIGAVYPDAVIVRNAADAAALVEAWEQPTTPLVAPVRAPVALRPPVFVVGVPRSGTTWLQNMLLAHPALAGPEDETSVFVSLRALRDNARRPSSESVTGWIDLPDLLHAMRAFAAALFSSWSPDKQIVEKTPLHAEHLPLIAELFPEASVISIHRDGRDVVRSLLEMEAATDSVDVAATRWAEITQRVRDTIGALPHARDERYETLLAEPVPKVTELLEWLGLSVDESVRAEIARRAAQRVSRYNTTGDVGAGKWKSLRPRQLRAVYRRAGERLLQLGYIDAVPRQSWWRR
jgi:hypothetical protein